MELDSLSEDDMYVRGGGDSTETMLPIRQEHCFGSATDGDDTVTSGTAIQTLTYYAADMQAASTPVALTQHSSQADVQTREPAADTPVFVLLSGPAGSPSTCEQQQDERELIGDGMTGVDTDASAAAAAEDPGWQVDEAIQDITTSLVDEALAAEDHGRQIHETTRDIASSPIDEVVAAQERDQEAMPAAEDILRGILDVAARVDTEKTTQEPPIGGQARPAGESSPPPPHDHHRCLSAAPGSGSEDRAKQQEPPDLLPQADDHPPLPSSDDGAVEGAERDEEGEMDWTVVDLQDDATEEVILLTDPAEAEDAGQDECASPRQLDGAADERGSLAAVIEAYDYGVYTGSGTAWVPAAPGTRQRSPRPRPQVEAEAEQVPQRRLTRSQRRAMELNNRSHL